MKQIMNFIRLLWYDLKRSVWQGKKKLILLIGVGMVSCLWFERELVSLSNFGIYPNPTLGDYFFYIFCGVIFYANEELRVLPQIWLLFQIYLLFLVCSYPSSCLKREGQQSLIRAKSRTFWWGEKCAWLVCAVLFYYTVMFASVSVFCAWRGIPFTLQVSDDISRFYYGIEKMGALLPPAEFRFLLFGMLPFISVVMGLLQQTISLLSRPQVGLTVLVAYLFASIREDSPFFLGNFAMLLRYRAIGGLEGIYPQVGLMIGGVMIGLSMLIGAVKFLRMDILEKEK